MLVGALPASLVDWRCRQCYVGQGKHLPEPVGVPEGFDQRPLLMKVCVTAAHGRTRTYVSVSYLARPRERRVLSGATGTRRPRTRPNGVMDHAKLTGLKRTFEHESAVGQAIMAARADLQSLPIIGAHTAKRRSPGSSQWCGRRRRTWRRYPEAAYRPSFRV